ncbi:MAG TPA: hypothetical protein VJN18_11670 [Polyangiaceae bacterium]|nr:hypothetical protein [Polyangiaceae bacterium]
MQSVLPAAHAAAGSRPELPVPQHEPLETIMDIRTALLASLASTLIACAGDQKAEPAMADDQMMDKKSADTESQSTEMPPAGEPESSPSSMAEPASKAPLLAIVTRAEWCSICKANAGRVGALLTKTASDGSLEVIANDITNEQTTEASAKELDRRGLKSLVSTAAPGLIYFVDPKTRMRVAEVSVAHLDEEIGTVTGLARKRLSSR